SHNQIKVVSEFAIILPALEVLDLFSNRITSLGMLLLCTPSLTHLLLGRNMITETPEGVEGLSGLHTLDISHNALSKLSSGLGLIDSLEELNLHENRISEIWPESFRGLAKIDLSNNSIGYLPPELGKIKSLVELKVLGNTFKTPRLQVVEKGTEALLEWLRLRLPDEEV
ncbi:hypothetical protein BZA70DRAFT_240615, partial [Myxozyma melibiosi]